MNAIVGHSSNGMGVANTAILSSLLDYLLAKQIIAPAEVIDVLDRACDSLVPNEHMVFVKDAIELISKLSTTFQNVEPQRWNFAQNQGPL